MNINQQILAAGRSMGKSAFSDELFLGPKAYRELVCNARDEGGDVYEGEADEAEQGRTTIVVTGEGIEEAHAMHDKIFFTPQDHDVIEGSSAEAFNDRSLSIYYRGIRVCEQSTLFTYNVKNAIDLTEDRTAKYNFQLREAIAEFLITEAPEEMVLAAVTMRKGYESGLEYDSHYPSEQFIEVVKKRMKDRQYVNSTAKRSLITRGLVKKETTITKTYHTGQEDTLEAAINVAKHVDPNFMEYEVEVVLTLDGDYCRIEDEEEKILYIEVGTLDSSYGEVAKYMLKTFWNHEHTIWDFQDFLFDKILVGV